MNKKNHSRKSRRVRDIKILVFFVVLTVMFVIGLLWFARPKESILEKRKLTEFPKFTVDTFLNGEYFKAIDTWYADTYPVREVMIAGDQALENLYGVRGDAIVGDLNPNEEDEYDPSETEEPDTTVTEEDEPDTEESFADESLLEETSEFTEEEPTEESTEAETLAEDELPDGTVTEEGKMIEKLYVTNHCAYTLYYFSKSGTQRFADTMNSIYKKVENKIDNMYVMVCPVNSGVMLDQKIIDKLKCNNNKDAIDFIESQMDPNIRFVNVYDNLKKHNAEYIYFHTDHHWTQLGAYYAYQVFCEMKGVTPYDISSYETVTYPNFLGTLYSKTNQSKQLKSNPDDLIAYYPHATNEMTMRMANGKTVKWDIIHNVSKYRSSLRYGAFAGGDQPFAHAHNDNLDDGSAILVFKDSFGNAFIPFLIDHYEDVYWVDYRVADTTISKMVSKYGIKDVLFEVQIYSATSTKKTAPLFTAVGK